MSIPGLQIIGDRIDAGCRTTRQLYDNEDFKGIQALAARQEAAGAAYLNVNLGRRAKDDPKFVENVIRCIQATVSTPLAFDYPDLQVQEVFLKTYDPQKAGGRKPLINSIAETRGEMVEATRIQPAARRSRYLC